MTLNKNTRLLFCCIEVSKGAGLEMVYIKILDHSQQAQEAFDLRRQSLPTQHHKSERKGGRCLIEAP